MQRLIGYQQAFELTLSGRIIDAAEAKSLGVVLEVVAPEHLMVRATELASRFAAQPPKALRLTKRLMKMAQRMELKDFLDLCATFQGMCQTNPSISWRCSACCRNNSWAVSQRGLVSSIDSRSFPMRMRPPASRRLAVPRAGLALAPASVIAVEAIAPHEGHLHFAFAATRGAKVQSRDLESFATSAHEPGFPVPAVRR